MFEPQSDTIFTETYHAYPDVPQADALVDKWTLLRAVRETLRHSGEGR